ncbi:MAG: hypothetical protein JSU83_23450 [Deltaproteobacteria bacterium]|nr:MAG: hypothetical protein JSU83_23450 [Deltaproteobacteria bacterium]
MKKLLVAMAAIFLMVGLVGCATFGSGGSKPAPQLVVVTPEVELSKTATVDLKGLNFEPDQEVALLFTAVDGVTSDIGFAVDPQPVADKTGTWATTWKCGRFVSKKLIKAGVYTIKAADFDYNVLAEATVNFIAKK